MRYAIRGAGWKEEGRNMWHVIDRLNCRILSKALPIAEALQLQIEMNGEQPNELKPPQPKQIDLNL
jgi:hypothetical protein